MHPARLAFVAVASLTILLAGCGGGSDTPAPTPTPAPSPSPTPTPTPSTPPPGPIVLSKERAYPNLTFVAAVTLLRAPNDPSRWFVVQQDGHVLSFADVPNAATTTAVLDISDRVVFRNVHGLLGMAFHPGFPADRRAYVAYTHETTPGVIVLRISELMTADNGVTLSAASEQIIFELAQPGGHNNGGHVLFGPDGFLYLGIGDGGNDDAASGVVGNGQTTNNLLGKILRLDISGTTAGRLYRIPSDNPFAGNAPCARDGTGAQDCPEIFAWGFRNPWRWSFDRQDGQLWLGDVGSHDREEVDRVTKGGNYGWRCFEGTRATSLNCGTQATPMLPPVAEYDHTLGVAVTGGYVYRGSAIPGLVGRYVFADYGSGRVWQIAADTAPTMTMTGSDAYRSGASIASFAEDTNGELLIVDVKSGALYRLVAG
jgi:glucose/arabinose dehydrogenase